ncbi:MAG: type II toxin-antitoxin system VapC family toxin [Candidatus Nitrosocosmicus sp.]
MIIIDTDALIEVLNKKSKKGQEIYEKMEQNKESFAITSITLYEILHFFMKMKMNTFPPLHLLQVYGFSKEAAQKAAELVIELEKKGRKVKATTLMISSIVINENAILCTLNKDFNELKDAGLKLFLGN